MNLDEVGQKMRKIVEHTRGEVAGIRTGRATPALVENVVVNAYGGGTKLRVQELASVQVVDAQSLVITPYDPSIIGEIRRDIESANIGLTPVLDNNVIRISVPPLTGERRMEYVRMLHGKLEDGRVKVRQVRHEMMGDVKKKAENKEINEDERERLEEELQKLTDEMMEEIQASGEAKETELVPSA